MNKFIFFISFLLVFWGCSKKASTFKPLDRPLVGVLVDGGFDDKSFNESAWMGAKKLGEDFSVDILGKDSTSANYSSDLEGLKDKGSSVIWGVGYRLQEVIKQAALVNTDVNYGIIDIAYSTGVGIPRNLIGLTFKVEEGAFLVGYIAAKTTKTGNIGFLGGIEGEVINAFRYGYEAGARYANKDIKVNAQYVGTFTDLSLGRSMASKMYSDGIDIIFAAAGLSGLGAIEVAKEMGEGYYVIGVDQDQSYLAPSNILTSVVKNVGDSLYGVTANYLKTKNFDGGKIVEVGLREGGISIVKDYSKIKYDISVEIESLENKIISGSILIPSNFDEYSEFLSIYSL
ncbi:BMP family ABC transporter substrate-binding protein [Borrelia turcica IST7]|uniref:BMP family ABC transporter substrate-binding protein n=1 Tax=Borrelia turcica IST7 TaxID=1104446 RepID=A0A386PKK7_9SPIR|nr:BMP family protein [Borrelia turcica]AYE36256.1 BMP family ABC transporter substrate-binding protein [Borrelia turcica IST7]